MASPPASPSGTPTEPETPAAENKSPAQEFYERMRQFTDDLLDNGGANVEPEESSEPKPEPEPEPAIVEPSEPPTAEQFSPNAPAEHAPIVSVAPTGGRKNRVFPGWARVALVGTVIAPLAFAGLVFGTPEHPTQLSANLALRLAGALSPNSPQPREDQSAAPAESQHEQNSGPDTTDTKADPVTGYTYDSPDGFSVTFPGEPEITEIPDPLGGNDTITLATYQSSDVFYQASFSGNPAARLTASDSARGSAAGIGADIASSVALNLPGVDAVATEVRLGEEPAWLLNAVVTSPDGVFVLIQGGTASRDDAFFDSFTINQQK